MERVFITLLLCIFLTCENTSFERRIEVSSTRTGLLNKIDSIVVEKMNQYEIPGLSIGIVHQDSMVYAKGYGVRNIKKPDLVTENSVFHTASISKLFTAFAILKLQELNMLSIDDRLVNIIPELNYSDDRVEDITLKSILNHTSGLPDIKNYGWRKNNRSDHSLKDFVLGLDLKLESAPTAQFTYSNLGYDILGYVIEKVSGTSFDDFQKENVLNPNGMYTSDFRYFKIPDTLRTSPHSKSRLLKNIYVRKTYPYTREHAPSSTLNASAKELATWMVSFLQLLHSDPSGSNYQAMISPSTDTHAYMGLGFQLVEMNGFKKIGHYGGDKGFRSYLMMIPEAKLGLVLLANCDYEEDFRQEILHPIARLMLANSKGD